MDLTPPIADGRGRPPHRARTLVKDRAWSTVWRLDDGLWLKQCKSIWRFEPRLTAALAGRWPDLLPELVDHGDDWMITRDAGPMVEDLPDAHGVWLEAVARYAALQRAETAYVAEHIAVGVPDQRTATLPAQYATMLERDDLPWPDGGRERLRRFEREFERLCEALGPVASIQHDDLHMHNVYAGPRILDWGDSCVSHPFFSMVVTFMFVPTGQDEIRDAYLAGYGAGGAGGGPPDRATFDLALRVGRIAHVFKWIRFRDVVAAEDLPAYDEHFASWLEQAVAQTPR